MADKLLKSIKFPTLPDRYVIGDTSLSEEGAAADAKAVGEALATKADTKGTYEDLIVGGAEQLMADGYEIDKEPYLFRTTGGSADVGNREYLDSIVGGTVAWNQLVLGGSASGSGTVSANYATIATLTLTNDMFPVGHKILAKGKMKSANGTYVWLTYSPNNLSQGGNVLTNRTSLTDVAFIYSVDSNYTGRRLRIVGMSGDTATWEDVMLFDLTQMFGTTIADYIYSLEQATAGAGVAWFRQYFPEDYYPYHAVSLESIQTSAHKTYDADGNVIGNYALDSSLTLRGVPKLVDGKLAFDGDVYPPSGEVQRRYGIVDLGTLDWVAGFGGFYTSGLYNVAKPPTDYYSPNAVCSKYPWVVAGSGNTGFFVHASASYSGLVIVVDPAYTDAATFKTAMSGVYLLYELAAPTTETADVYEQYQKCDPSGTEEFVTTGIVPVGHETRYPHDLKKKIETAPDSPSTDGTYLMKRSGGKNTYMALPSTPSANGSYVLTVTVSGGSASYSWAKKE